MWLNNQNKIQQTVGLYRTPSFSHDIIDSVSTRNDLKDKISDPAFLEAIYVASPKFHNVLISWLDDKYVLDSKDDLKISQTAYKYLSRACYRCTPYGLFSKTFTSKIKIQGNITEGITLPEVETRIIELDAVIIQKIIVAIKHSLKSTMQLKYSVNNSVAVYDNEIHYYNNQVRNDQFIDYELIKVESNEVLQEILSFFRSGTPKTIYECVNQIHLKFSSFSTKDIESYLIELVNEHILISSLDSCLISEAPLESILLIIQEIKDPKTQSKWNQLISKLIGYLNNVSKPLIEIHGLVKDLLGRIDIDLENNKSIFHIENKVENCSKEDSTNTVISNRLFKQMKEVRNLLNDLNSGSKDNLGLFKKKFKQRYGSQKVLLIDVMNPLKGIGYVLKNEDLYNLPELTGVKIPERNHKNVILNSFEQRLHRELLNNNEIIDLTKLVKPRDKQTKDTKNSKSMMAFVKIINGGKNLFIREFSEITATRFLNRFSKIHPSLEMRLEEICKEEEDACREKDQVLAEFVHIPEIRMTNLLRFNHRRKYQIGTVLTEQNGKTSNIPLSDIYIQLIDNELVLFSKSIGKEIIPIISNSLNSKAYPLNMYNFIYDLQGQNNHFDLHFKWGNLPSLFNYLPRVIYKDIILSPAIWKINKQEINTKEEFWNWKQRRNLPTQFYFGNSIVSDELLYINLETDIGKQVFLNELNRKESLFVFEILEQNQFISDKKQSGYLHELLIPMLNDHQHVNPLKNNLSNNIQERFNLGDNWLYFKLYCTNIWAENFLKNYLSQLIEDDFLKKRIISWFFIRYQDEEGYHLRIRFNLDESTDRIDSFNRINKFFNQYTGNFRISKITIDTYEREIHRYGFSNIVYCEKIFFYDSENTIQILRNNIQDRFLTAIYGIDNYLNIFEFSDSDKEILLQNLSISFLNEFNINKESRKHMNLKYRLLSDRIENVLNEPIGEIGTIFQKNYIHMKKEVTKIKLSKEETFEVVASLIHMFLNRLLTSNPRYNEMFIYYNLAKHYRRVNQLNKVKFTDV